MYRVYIFIIVLATKPAASASAQDVSPLFADGEPMAIRLEYSFSEVRNETVDSVYFPALLHFNHSGKWDSVEVRIRGRGNWRRKHCHFTPIRMKMKKNEAKGTIFEQDRDLKLVLPCKSADQYNSLIVKEYLCYQLYMPVTEYYFNTRLVDIELTDQKKSRTNDYQVKGIFIEEDKKIARRFNGRVIDNINVHPYHLHDTTTTILDFFAFMIGNTDFSTSFQHNNKIIETAPRKFIPVPYDFDMCGLVDAPYATVNESLTITSVRQRLYKGYCRDESVVRYVRNRFLNAHAEMETILDRHKKYFEEKEYSDMKDYMKGFFAILEDDKKFEQQILSACRTPGN